MRRRSLLAPALALALVITSCGDDGADTTAGTPEASITTTTTEAVTTTEAPEPEDPCVLWYTDFSTGTLTKYDLCAAECVASTTVGESAARVDVAFGSVWVTDCIGAQLVRVDVTTNEVTGRVNIPGCPSDMLLADQAIWLVLPDMPGLMEIDPYTGEILSQIMTDDPPLSMQIGSLWVGFMDMLAWTADEVHAVGKTTLGEVGYQSIPTGGVVKSIGGDPLFVETMFSTDGSDESSRISSVDHTGAVTPLADLPGWYKSVVQWGDYFLAIAPYLGNIHVGMLNGSESYDIPVEHPYSIKKGLENPPGNPPGQPPGRRPPNPPNQPPGGPGGPPGQPIVIANKACDVWFWPNGSHDSLSPQGNCACSWTPSGELTDMTAATYSRLAAEEEFAATLPPGFPMEEPAPVPSAGPSCTSSGYSMQDGGRTILDVHSTWEEDGTPVVGLEVWLYLTNAEGWFWSGSTVTTDGEGVATFEGVVDLDEIAGAPGAGSTLMVGMTPSIDGVMEMGVCESRAEV